MTITSGPIHYKDADIRIQYRTRITSPKMRAFASHANAYDVNGSACDANGRIRCTFAQVACECAHNVRRRRAHNACECAHDVDAKAHTGTLSHIFSSTVFIILIVMWPLLPSQNNEFCFVMSWASESTCEFATVFCCQSAASIKSKHLSESREDWSTRSAYAPHPTPPPTPSDFLIITIIWSLSIDN